MEIEASHLQTPTSEKWKLRPHICKRPLPRSANSGFKSTDAHFPEWKRRPHICKRPPPRSENYGLTSASAHLLEVGRGPGHGMASLGLFQTLPGDGASGRNIGRSFLEEDRSFWKAASEHRQVCNRSNGSICLSRQLQRFLTPAIENKV